jgi:hypothetical protein
MLNKNQLSYIIIIRTLHRFDLTFKQSQSYLIIKVLNTHYIYIYITLVQFILFYDNKVNFKSKLYTKHVLNMKLFSSNVVKYIT